MKLSNKISLMTLLLGVFVVLTSFGLYNKITSETLIANAKEDFSKDAQNNTFFIKHILKDQLHIVKTMSLAPVILQGLEESNAFYKNMSDEERTNHINALNTKWKEQRLSKSAFINSYLTTKIAKYLKKQQLGARKIYGEIFLTNQYGEMIATTGVLSTLKHSQKYWWQQSYNNGDGKVFFDDRGFDESVKGYVLGVVIPIKEDNKTVGILKANINILGNLEKLIQDYDEIHSASLKIVRSKGGVVLEKDKEPLSTRMSSRITKELSKKTFGSLSTKDSFVVYSPIDFSKENIGFGGKKSGWSDHKKGNDNEIWNTVIEVDNTILSKTQNKFNQLMLYALLVIFFLSIVISLFIGTFISKPIVNLAKIIKEYGKGNLSARSDRNSADAVGDLARSFNTMAQDLETTMISRDELELEVEKRRTTEKKLQNEIKKARELINIVENSMNEIYIFKEEDFKFLYANRSALQNIGYSFDELKDKITLDLKINLDFESFSKRIKPLVDKSVEFLTFFTTNKRKDGTTYPAQTNLQLIEFEGVKSIVAIVIDRTEEENLNQKLQQQNELMLAQSRHAAMGEMISMIAHQWRQPLSVISMCANNIIADVHLESTTDEALLEVSNDILFEADYLSKTIDDFRDFFKPEKNVESVDIQGIFDEVLKIMGASFSSNNIEVLKDFRTHKKIETYSRELLQVLLNILKNAKDALVENTTKERKIEFIVEELEKHVIISIRDNAGGIDDAIMGKIFDPYFSTKNEKNGTGLGLYMSKTIIEKHLQGTIEATNYSDGVSFKITLPFKTTRGK